MYRNGAHVAVRSDEEPFWIAQCKETISDANTTKRFKIQWLERTCAGKDGTTYSIGPKDTIFFENIICEVKMIRLSRFRLLLSLAEEKIILNENRENVSVDDKFDIFMQLDTATVIQLEHFQETESIFSGQKIVLSDAQKQELLPLLPSNSRNKEDKNTSNDSPPKNWDELNSSIEKGERSSRMSPLQQDENQLSMSRSESEEEPFQSSGSEYKPSGDEQESSAASKLKNNSNNSCIESLSPLAYSSPIQLQNSSKNITKTYFDKSASTSEESSSSITSRAFVQCVKKTKSGGRIYDKKHACYFCDKLVGKITRHMKLAHKDETEVAKLLTLAPNSTQRKNGFLCLLRTGDYYHNCQVLTTKQGELILSRRPIIPAVLKDYGPCPNCLGFFQLNILWRHAKNNCPYKNKTQLRKDVKGESYAMLSSWSETNTSFEFKKDILAAFKKDEVSELCKTDAVIIRLGALMYEKFSIQQHDHIRQIMRQLGRLVLAAKQADKDIINISAVIQPEKFDMMINAIKVLCKSSTNDNKSQGYGIPSLALKLGQNLRKCAQIIRGNALRLGDLALERRAKGFLELMELEWSHRISSNAIRTLSEKKMNCEQLLPITEDLLKINGYLDDVIKCCINNINLLVDVEKNWSRLARATLSRLILFNKRRSGEASRMTLVQYSSRPDWKNQCTSELKDTLTPLEIQLADRLTVVEVFGKSRKNPKVPILLDVNIKEAIDKLLETRHLVEINPRNIYIFPTFGASINNLRGDAVLRKFAMEADLQKPELITSTKIRKYIATVVQIFNLNENETDWLAKHLGHDIRIHRGFYRLHESAVELTKVSRILLAVDKGQVSSFKGKRLEEIYIKDLPEPEVDSDTENFDPENDNDINNQYAVSGSSSNSGLSLVTPKRQMKKFPNSSKTVKQRKKWTTEEVAYVLNRFKGSIKSGSLPGKTECTACLEENPGLFTGRKWSDVKFYIKNYLSNMNKRKT